MDVVIDSTSEWSVSNGVHAIFQDKIISKWNYITVSINEQSLCLKHGTAFYITYISEEQNIKNASN